MALLNQIIVIFSFIFIGFCLETERVSQRGARGKLGYEIREWNDEITNRSVANDANKCSLI
jgi:hypothetical protein